MAEKTKPQDGLKDRAIFSGEIKATEDGTYSYIVSDGKIDRDDEIVNVDGINVKEFNKKPVILWAHNHSIPAIAKAKRAYKKDGNLIIEGIKFPEPGIHPLADTVAGLVKDGIIDSMSIGFRSVESIYPQNPKAGEPWRQISKSELYETSFVNVGSNRGTERIKSAVGDDLFKVLSEPTIETACPELAGKSMDEAEDVLFCQTECDPEITGVTSTTYFINDDVTQAIKQLTERIETLTGEVREIKAKQVSGIVKSQTIRDILNGDVGGGEQPEQPAGKTTDDGEPCIKFADDDADETERIKIR